MIRFLMASYILCSEFRYAIFFEVVMFVDCFGEGRIAKVNDRYVNHGQACLQLLRILCGNLLKNLKGFFRIAALSLRFRIAQRRASGELASF